MHEPELSKMKVGVLGGGVSGEREISLISSQEALLALKRQDIAAVFIDINTTDKEKVKELILKQKIDIAFIALHGEFGEDGQIQKILEELGLSYTGSGPLASHRAMDKLLSKEIFLKYSLPTPAYLVCRKNSRTPFINKYPVVVKPYFSGSSLGISIVNKKEALPSALEKAFSFQEVALIEEYIEGKELTVGILEDRPLAVVEIIYAQEYFDFWAKYSDAKTTYIAPANLERNVYERVQATALAAHYALGCRHFCRVDIRLNPYGIPYILEVNSIPGLTSHSLLPLSARVCGINFEALILKMLTLALYEKKQFQKV